MKNIKYELQHIIQGDGEQGNSSLIKTIQNFLRRNEKTSAKYSQKKLLKNEEEKCLILKIVTLSEVEGFPKASTSSA